jgi:hypothetical protein
MTQPDLNGHLERYARRTEELIRELRASDPSLPLVSAIILSGDIFSGELMADEVESGREKATKVVWQVGSYARMEWALRHCGQEWALKNLPELWVSSDPDDTKPEYMRLWRTASALNDCEIICDGKPLAFRAHSHYRIYRGQSESAPVGISWTLSRATAKKFASNGGSRVPIHDGVILERSVKRDQILAYLTTRGEEEIILDLEDIR